MSYRRNVAVVGFKFALINKSTGAAVTTGTCTGFVTLGTGAQAALGGAITHKGNGEWIVDAITAAEMNDAVVGLTFVHTDAVTVHHTIKTVAFDPDDTVRLGATALPAVASGSAGAVVTSGTGTAQLSTSGGQVTVAGFAAAALTALADAVWGYLKATAAALATTTIGRFFHDQIAFITSATILTSGPYSDGELITIFQGEDRKVALTNHISFVIPSTITPGSGWTGKLKLTRLEGAGTATLTKSVTPAGQTCNFTLTDAETSASSANAATINPTNTAAPGYAYRWTFTVHDGTDEAVLSQHFLSVKAI